MCIEQVCNASLEFEPKKKLIGERPLNIHSAMITSGSSIGIRVKISMVITRRQSVKATNSSISSNQTQYFQETTHDAVYMNLDRGLDYGGAIKEHLVCYLRHYELKKLSQCTSLSSL